MACTKIILTGFWGCVLSVFPAFAQLPHDAQHPPDAVQSSGAGQQHAGMPSTGSAMSPTEAYLMQQASGTATNPASSPGGMFMQRVGSWTTMLHGVFSVNETQQSGPRGGDKFFATNWFMGTAQRRVGAGSLQARAMLSLEPATVTRRRYPLLLQNGETAFGNPIADGQHPHDFVMELGAQYARRIGESTILGLYAAPVGDPALGPVAFPHRISAQELPQAALGHHLQDSTHIANTVVTLGFKRGMLQIEASGFHGEEPNENRWNFDGGTIDSWSSRLSLAPAPNWNGQVSVGRLARPEAHEPYDIIRATASVTYNRPLATGFWAASLIWGRNHKTGVRRNTNSYLAESVLQMRRKNYLTGRVELVDRDELLHGGEQTSDHADSHSALAEGAVFRVAALTLGYTRGLGTIAGVEVGLGGNVTLYRIPAALTALYGNRPAGFLTYLRFRLKGHGGGHAAAGH